MKKITLLLWWGVCVMVLQAQENFFVPLPLTDNFIDDQRSIKPNEFLYLEADTVGLKEHLWAAPSEQATTVNDSEQIIYLPDPDGNLVGFHIVSYALLKPASASQYPGIKTFYGREIGKGPRRIRLGWTYRGFHATIDGDRKGSWYIDPYTRQDKVHYQSYRKQALAPPVGGFSCGVEEGLQLEEELAPTLTDTRKIGDCQFRLYDLVISTTGEYYQYVGGNDTDVIAEITTAVNRVNSVVERDLSLRLQLIIDTDLLFSDGTSDPYDDSDGLQIIGVSTGVMDAEVANYDIGHVFSTGGGGVAYRPSVCIDDFKGGGVTGLSNPTGDVFYIDYVAHEMGHQFGASHTFNAVDSRSCVVETINTDTAFEPGSGSTIMAYAGICEPQNLQSNSDDYFHVGSLIEIAAYMKNGFGASCATIDPVLSNTAPTVNAGVDYIIPANTPFVLTASGNDADGHSLSYTWEQYDAGGGASTPPNGTETDDPLFRSWPPTTSPERYFPDYFDYLDNDPDPYEALPSVGRIMTFKVTARDGAAGFGCPTEDEMTVTTVASSGFALISPNGGESWRAGTTNEVAWDVAGSNTNGIDIATVDIELSLDGGSTYPYLLASGTANDGSFMATLPDVESPSARIRIVPTNSIFYAVSANGFSMERNTFTLDGDLTRISCGGTNTLTVPFNVNSVQGYVGTVSLGIVGAAPAGTTATLNPVSVSLTADETEVVNLELGGLSNLASGTSYFYTIEGTDGTETKQIMIEVFRGGERSELVAPADGAVVDRTQPVFFDWEPVTEADGYRWQMYVGNLVYFFNTSATSVNLTLSSDIPDGTYDWEVVAISSSCNTEIASLRRAVTLSSGFLPVSWISFTAQPKENEVQLDWKVEQTAEHLGFELERSLDSRQFEKLSWVGAQGEPGPMAYRYTDATAASGKTYYYRLRQLDQDGTSSYSRIVKVVFNQGAGVENLSLHPNPVGETLFVTADEQYWNRPYRILAVTGQFVQQGILRTELDVSPLAPGLYFLELPESGHSVRFLRK